MDKKDFLTNNYLQIVDKDKDWGLFISNVGHAGLGTIRENRDLYHTMRLYPNGRSFDSFNIVYIASGSMLYYPNPRKAENITISAGNIIIIPPNVKNRYHANPATGVEEYWIKFDGFYARTLQRNGILPRENLLLNVNNPQSILKRFNQIHNDSIDQLNLSTQRNCFLQLIELISFLTSPKHDNINPIVEEAISLMQAKVNSEFDFAGFAKNNGMTLHNFRRVFKLFVGLPPLHYFLELKVNKAKALLEKRNHSVKEVAFMLGFEDQFYFSRLFKKRTGVTPTQWH